MIHQLDVAMEDRRVQRAGIVFVYNMYGSKYSNFDYDLSQKMLTLLKGCYPARLQKVLIVTAPLWFKAPFKVRTGSFRSGREIRKKNVPITANLIMN